MTRFKTLFAPKQATLPDATWLVVGLGNPGAKYAATRHNVGYMCVDLLIDATPHPPLAPLAGYKAEATQLTPEALAVRSTTFMNQSGQGVAPLAETLGIPPERIIVIHDELDLPAGTVRVKKGGNENGHNGLKSLTHELGTRDYLRVRIGISRPPAGQPVPEYVLEPVSDGQPGIELAAEAVNLILSKGLAAAQNEIHGR
ncbi:Peptidyl-tRNA hydrolase 2 [Corynebacterium deserti GIMN1.010]|uniref:Peptidyl-tRNA hydrolase n=1 Tax=Corynebacterium deserti GIMN1.010 TaxID=931089 RepID=A0A0M3Q9B8_9CORY|nr:aminoacyl-tRNA hydrolase [Corynebacterium deserti]ALC05369.1 Peptidyl-tRNA hydrolase 2 [Corynebacterium deserti GIMN1.010]